MFPEERIKKRTKKRCLNWKQTKKWRKFSQNNPKLRKKWNQIPNGWIRRWWFVVVILDFKKLNEWLIWSHKAIPEITKQIDDELIEE